MCAVELITSIKNPACQRFRRAAAGRFREVVFAEGVRLVADAIARGVPVREVLVAPRLVTTPAGRALRRELQPLGRPIHECADHVLERISRLTTHQGVIALLERPRHELAEIFTGRDAPLVVVAAGVRDPGNLGALVRAAHAAGASGFVALEGGADPFGDKAVRGSAGSVLRLPVVAGADPKRVAAALGAGGIRGLVAVVRGGECYLDVDLRGPCALMVGGETGDLPEELAAVARPVTIPMAEGVESLNVAVAAGVLLYEARRQRR